MGIVDIVSTVLICLIAATGFGSLGWARWRQHTALKNLDAAASILDGVTSDNLFDSRALLAERSQTLPDVARAAWREFNETLVSENDAHRVWNTVEAEQFFDGRRFAPQLVGNRLLDAVPTFLTTLGLVGTFVGLAVGLNAIDLDGSADAMKGGIATLVRGAGVGFKASLVGVGASLIASVLLKLMERGVNKRALRLQNRIDALFELRSPEQSLTTIATATQASAEALAELHEKIGAQLQETMGSALQTLAADAGKQSTMVFEQVADMLTGAFRDLSTRVAAELTDAAATMRSTIEYMGDQLARQADQYAEQMAHLQAATTRQVELLDEKLPAVVESIDQAASRIGTASDAMAESSANLSNTASGLEQISARFSTTLASSVEAFERITARNDEASAALESLATQMVGLTATTSEAATGLRETARALTAGFTVMREHQVEFLDDLDVRLSRQIDTLAKATDAQSERMAGWLADYSDKVSKQTSTRMDEWNRHTEGYTTAMLNAVNALSSAVDELDTRATTGTLHADVLVADGTLR